MSTRLVALDLDGTLLGAGGHLSDRSAAALAATHDAGIVVVVATGRPPMMLGGLIERAGASVDYAVGANGSMIGRFPGPELLRLVGFDLEVARAAVVALRDADPRFGFALATDAGFVHEPGFAERMPAAVDSAPGPDVLALGGTEALKLLVFHPEIPTTTLLEQLPSRVGDQLVVSHMGADAAELGPVGIDKGSGLIWLCDHLGIAAADVIAFGDELNDLTMLQWAGRGIAMANADARVRAVADEVAPPNTDDGVAVILEALLAD